MGDKGAPASTLWTTLRSLKELLTVDILHERISVEEGKSIQEDDDSQDGSWDQQLGVPAQPQVVQSHLLSKIRPVRTFSHIKVTRTQKHLLQSC